MGPYCPTRVATTSSSSLDQGPLKVGCFERIPFFFSMLSVIPQCSSSPSCVHLFVTSSGVHKFQCTLARHHAQTDRQTDRIWTANCCEQSPAALLCFATCSPVTIALVPILCMSSFAKIRLHCKAVGRNCRYFHRRTLIL